MNATENPDGIDKALQDGRIIYGKNLIKIPGKARLFEISIQRQEELNPRDLRDVTSWYPTAEEALYRASQAYLEGIKSIRSPPISEERKEGEPQTPPFAGPHLAALSQLNEWFTLGGFGRYFFARREDDQGVVVGIHRLVNDPPHDVIEEVRNTGKSTTWADTRGFTYQITPSCESSVEHHASIRPADRPETGMQRGPYGVLHFDVAYFYPVIKEGKGPTFLNALEEAIKAEEREIR